VNLRLSRRGDYVVRSAVCLARAFATGRATELREVSAQMGVPRTYVSQILGDLVRAKVAVSSAGVHGGYRLARPPSEVTLLEIVEAGEGALSPACCALGDGPFRWEQVCPIHDAWERATGALRAELSATSLADLAATDEAIEAGSLPVHPAAHRPPMDAVHVAGSVEVALPAAAVADRLEGGGSWLPPHMGAAARGEAIHLRVGPGGPAWLGKTVAVRLGKPERSEDALEVPVTWEATGASGLFPRFEGVLSVADVDAGRCALSLAGRYRPPLGRAGQVLDEALLARVARATVQALLRRIALGLEDAQAVTLDVPVTPVAGTELAKADR
jgi:Rrf2 family protein